MQMSRFVSVVLMTYNERGNIIPLVEGLSAGFQAAGIVDFEVIVVDDDSPDRTWQAVVERWPDNRSVKVIRRVGSRGLASALRDGIAVCRGDIIASMDADGSHSAQAMMEVVKKVSGGSDFVQASRYVPGSAVIRNSGALDRGLLFSRILNGFLRLLLIHSVTDYTGALFACRRDVWEKVKVQDGYGEFFIKVLWDLDKAGYRIEEIPYTNLPRRSGESKTGTRIIEYLVKGWKYVLLGLRLRFGQAD